MRVLITGAGGFVGWHLSAHLAAEANAALTGTTFLPGERTHPVVPDSRRVNLVDEGAALALIESCRPDFIYHLAAQAFVPRSFDDPWGTLENNIRAQLNIIRACLELDIRPRMLVVSSAEIYGGATPDELPMDESAPIRPTNPYSVSKVAQDMLGLQYHISHGLPIMRARPFNHIGPGQNARFVAPAFALQIAQIEASASEAVIYVGNLSAKRDFTDVRDIVRAYHVIATRGTPGEAYNIASGKSRSIESLLETLLGLTNMDIATRADPQRLRPVDVPEIIGDASKLRRDTGWQPSLTFEETLRDVLDDCRQRVQREDS